MNVLKINSLNHYRAIAAAQETIKRVSAKWPTKVVQIDEDSEESFIAVDPPADWKLQVLTAWQATLSTDEYALVMEVIDEIKQTEKLCPVKYGRKLTFFSTLKKGLSMAIEAIDPM